MGSPALPSPATFMSAERADHAGAAASEQPKLTDSQTEALVYMLQLIDQFAAEDKKQLFKSFVDGRTYPTYYEKIREPMCFDEMREKLRGQQYRTLRGFQYDLRLIFENAK